MTETLKTDFIAIVEALEKARKEAADLRKRNEELEKRIEIYRKQIDTLKGNIEGASLSPAKERIDSLCKQVQECIDLLKR
ncbi:MAG: hypothetical protein HUJ95_03055 [Bacteroidales bacterium]|nr:hypothetical protein [Bacteroidales bacterium]